MRTTARLAACLVAFAVAGCGQSLGRDDPRQTRPDLASTGNNNNGDAGDHPIDPGSIDGSVNNDCPDQAKLVYVVDENNMLSSFRPDLLQFTNIGTLSCVAQFGATPFSMAVDRSATAWVLYSSGELFQVSTTDASCTPTSFQPNQPGFGLFGMGFVSNAVGSNFETLFVAGADQIGTGTASLGTINMKNLVISRVGTVAGNPELTGTGDARLWGFFPEDANPRVTQIDKTSGNESNPYPVAIAAGTPMAWAFAFWGGDFWVFLQRDIDTSTKVYQVKGQGGAVTVPLPDTGRKIVGAGVSTCAPLTIG
jgi:hypothetical protein